MRILWKLRQQLLEDGSCVCDQCPGEDEHVQNEVHALLICQDHRVCELKNIFLFTPFFEDFLAAQPFLLQQVNNQLVHDFLSQQSNRLFLFYFWAYGFICGWPRPVSSRSAKLPGWRSPPIVTIVTIVCDQCPGEDEHVQNEVHALLICQDHRVCELRKHFSFLFSPFFEDFSAAQPFLLQQPETRAVGHPCNPL